MMILLLLFALTIQLDTVDLPLNSAVKITIARMKFAIGPAATMAARGPTFL